MSGSKPYCIEEVIVEWTKIQQGFKQVTTSSSKVKFKMKQYEVVVILNIETLFLQ